MTTRSAPARHSRSAAATPAAQPRIAAAVGRAGVDVRRSRDPRDPRATPAARTPRQPTRSLGPAVGDDDHRGQHEHARHQRVPQRRRSVRQRLEPEVGERQEERGSSAQAGDERDTAPPSMAAVSARSSSRPRCRRRATTIARRNGREASDHQRPPVLDEDLPDAADGRNPDLQERRAARSPGRGRVREGLPESSSDAWRPVRTRATNWAAIPTSSPAAIGRRSRSRRPTSGRGRKNTAWISLTPMSSSTAPSAQPCHRSRRAAQDHPRRQPQQEPVQVRGVAQRLGGRCGHQDGHQREGDPGGPGVHHVAAADIDQCGHGAHDEAAQPRDGHGVVTDRQQHGDIDDRPRQDVQVALVGVDQRDRAAPTPSRSSRNSPSSAQTTPRVRPSSRSHAVAAASSPTASVNHTSRRRAA